VTPDDTDQTAIGAVITICRAAAVSRQRQGKWEGNKVQAVV